MVGMEGSGGIVCWEQIVLGGLEREWEGSEGIVCWQQIVLGEFDRVWEWKVVWELCADSRLC